MKKSISTRVERAAILANVNNGIYPPQTPPPLQTPSFLCGRSSVPEENTRTRVNISIMGHTNTNTRDRAVRTLTPPLQAPLQEEEVSETMAECGSLASPVRVRWPLKGEQEVACPHVSPTLSDDAHSLDRGMNPQSRRDSTCMSTASTGSIGTGSTGTRSEAATSDNEQAQVQAQAQQEQIGITTPKNSNPNSSNLVTVVTLLPADYEPTQDDVLCGRGYKTWEGNQRYKSIVHSKLPEYAAATSKLDKSWILVAIVQQVRRKSPNGGFLKKCPDTGRWFEVGDFLAKEKTSQYFRDALHERYRSSGQSKYKRRKIEAIIMKDQTEGSVCTDRSDSVNHNHGSMLSRRSSGHSSLQEILPQRVSSPSPSPSEAAVVSALQAMACSAAPTPDLVVCAMQLAMRRPNESLFEASMRVLDGMTRVSCQHKVDLFVLPELSPMGYSQDTFTRFLPTTPKLQETYRQIDEAFANQARILQSYICYGTIGWKIRPDGSVGCTIRQIVLDRSGLLVASYDKIHLCDYGNCAETRFFEAGPREPVSFSIDGFRFGLMISADVRNPTLSRSLARDHKIDVLLQPAAFTRDTSFRTTKSFRETRAVENSVYFVGVNYAGEAFGETSVVPPWVDESHEPHVLGTAEGFLLGRIQRSKLDSVRASMPFYRQLCAEISPKWHLNNA